LIRDIESRLADTSVPLEDILLSCRILAQRLQSEELRDWINYEINGYVGDVDVPPYRIVSSQALADIFGPLGAEQRNMPIPGGGLPDEIAEFLTTVELRHGVAGLEDMIATADQGVLKFPLPADLSAAISAKILSEGWNIAAAYRVTAVSAVKSVLSTVRNRLLDFALRIEADAPGAGEEELGTPSLVTPEKVEQTFNVTILGGNVAVASTDFTQYNYEGIQPGDVAGLVDFFRGLGVEAEDLSDLEKAVTSDPTPSEKGKFGPRVAAWMSKMVGKAASGIWRIGVSAAGQVLAAALTNHYGWS